MLITRDAYLCILSSLLFELLELTFRIWLPNFYECWWDSLILDFLISNNLGIFIGYLIIKWFKLRKQNWNLKQENAINKSFIKNLKELFICQDLIEH